MAFPLGPAGFGGNGSELRDWLQMRLRSFLRVPLLLIAVAGLVVLFVLSRTNPGNSYQRVGTSEIVSLINKGQVNSALITDKNRTIQITAKSGKQLEATWNPGQGPRIQNALQTQLAQGSLPGGYNVTAPQSHAPLDVLLAAFALLVIVLLLFWGTDYPGGFRRWRAFADQAGHMAKRWVQQT